MTLAIEITTFKLDGCTCAEFIAANAELDQWLGRQPGFQSRTMAEQKDGTITDMLFWDSVAQGTASMHRLMDELRDSPVHGMIDQDTVSWSIAPVRHQIGD
jgi:hypothetical protein